MLLLLAAVGLVGVVFGVLNGGLLCALRTLTYRHGNIWSLSACALRIACTCCGLLAGARSSVILLTAGAPCMGTCVVSWWSYP
jgi:hypothetical protein